jgi:hypothetical protein
MEQELGRVMGDRRVRPSGIGFTVAVAVVVVLCLALMVYGAMILARLLGVLSG